MVYHPVSSKEGNAVLGRGLKSKGGSSPVCFLLQPNGKLYLVKISGDNHLTRLDVFLGICSSWWRVFMWRVFLSKTSPCHCLEPVSCGFSDTHRHPGRQVRRKARNGCAPIQLEACKTRAVSPHLFLLQLCLHLQLENITFPTWVNAVSLHCFSPSVIEP